jgi:hypothetical protein
LLGFQENSVHFGDIILFHWHSFPETANEIALKLQAIPLVRVKAKQQTTGK